MHEVGGFIANTLESYFFCIKPFKSYVDIEIQLGAIIKWFIIS